MLWCIIGGMDRSRGWDRGAFTTAEFWLAPVATPVASMHFIGWVLKELLPHKIIKHFHQHPICMASDLQKNMDPPMTGGMICKENVKEKMCKGKEMHRNSTAPVHPSHDISLHISDEDSMVWKVSVTDPSEMQQPQSQNTLANNNTDRGWSVRRTWDSNRSPTPQCLLIVRSRYKISTDTPDGTIRLYTDMGISWGQAYIANSGMCTHHWLNVQISFHLEAITFAPTTAEITTSMQHHPCNNYEVTRLITLNCIHLKPQVLN